MTSSTKAQTPVPSLIGWVIGISALVIPLIISPSGRDTFRLPKDIAFRAEVVLLVALVICGLILRQIDFSRLAWRKRAFLVPLAALVWTGVCTVASTNRNLSLSSLAFVASACIIFSITVLVAHRARFSMLYWILGAGLVNATLYLLQASALWNPFRFTSAYQGHNAATGFLGNANDVGSFLLPVTIAATAAALASREGRTFTSITAVISGAAILASVSIASIGGLLAALASLALIWNWKRALALITVTLIVLGVLARLHEPFSFRISVTVDAVSSGEWDTIFSGRLSPYASALAMFSDHPWTGVGPGVFGWQYYPYKLELSNARPDLFMTTPASRSNFEEVHNDHLEILAETGAPGYLLFLTSLVLLARGSFRGRRETESDVDDARARFTRYVRLPLAVGIAVTCLAQYPLQLTSSVVPILFVAGISVGWSDMTPVEEVDDA